MILLRSRPRPDIGWRVPVVAVLMGLFLPCLVGGAILYLIDVPLTGLPKDGAARSFGQHLGFVAAALTAAPIIAWMVLPLVIPALRLMIQTGWAGSLAAVALSVGLGLPLVHWMLNGDVTTEDTAVLGHIVVAMIVQALTGWAVLQVLLRER